jgi:hypothetical protein
MAAVFAGIQSGYAAPTITEGIARPFTLPTTFAGVQSGSANPTVGSALTRLKEWQK